MTVGPAWRATLARNAANAGCWMFLPLIVVVVFDPSDLVFGVKAHAYAMICVWLLYYVARAPRTPDVHRDALLLVFLFGAIFPLFSVLSYVLRGADLEPYAGFQNLKAFAFLSILLVLDVTRTDVYRHFIAVLDLQAFVTLLIFALLALRPDLREPLTEFGYSRGFLWLHDRTYAGVTFPGVFFKTSPLLVLSLAYHAHALTVAPCRRRALAAVLLPLGIVAMILSGTRANLLFALLTPAIVVTWYSACPALLASTLLALSICLAGIYSQPLIAMLSPDEFSNAVKLGYLPDYLDLLSRWDVLLFGQGIGAFHYFTSLRMDLSLTELTALEILRNFGLIIGPLYVLLFCLPLLLLIAPQYRQYTPSAVGYASYLAISLTNAYLLSSTGIFLLSLMLYRLLNPAAAAEDLTSTSPRSRFKSRSAASRT